MISSVRIDINTAGIGELLSRSETQEMLDDKAEDVAEAARSIAPDVEGEPGMIPLPIGVVDAGTSSRARALVTIDHPSGLAVEAKHRLLVGCLDAARW